MDTNKTDETVSSESTGEVKRKRGRPPRVPGAPAPAPKEFELSARAKKAAALNKALTPTEKATAAALWRSGEMTLEQIAGQMKRRPETLSRLFTEMGIKKGEAAEEHQRKVQAELEAKLLNDASQHVLRIAKVKEEHFKMADGMGKLIWSELVKAKTEGKRIDTLRGTMHTLQMAAAALSNVRKELYDILRVEEHETKTDDDDLPELKIAELSPEQIADIQSQQKSEDETGLDIEEVADIDVPEQPQEGGTA